jgi:hypothetical protein
MDFSLCPYKYLFGKPDKGVHQYKFFNIALVDLGATIATAYFISKFNNLDFKEVLFLLFILGIILHNLFCVRTTIDKIIFI